MGAFFWNGFVRIVLFWAVFVGVLYALDMQSTTLDFVLIRDRLTDGARLFSGTISQDEFTTTLKSLSEPKFVFSLAFAIGAVAAGFIVCFFLFHVCAIIFNLMILRRNITRHTTLEAFAKAYDQSVYPRLMKSKIIGHAWREFDETLVPPKPDDRLEMRNTVRPQSFINIGIARERLIGLKMMSSIPGYFVAVGLLLTFTGIVLALYKAGEASSANDVKIMQAAMTELLQIASFKFATSIAGLGCSLLLSIIFKFYSIWIESSFNAFCEAAEQRLKYVPPQSLALEMNEAAKEQRDQLKEINSDKFFAQMGRQLEPQIQSAFSAAMSPINQSISAALDKISETSQSGVSDMLSQFSNSVQGSAGTELRELAETLKVMQQTIAETQSGVKGSGEDFARRMSEAAENLNRLVSDAARNMDDSANKNRDGLNDILAAMKVAFDRANSQIDEQLGKAAGGASERIETAMGRVMEKLESQIGSLTSGISGFDGQIREGLAQTNEQIKAAQENAVSTVSAMATGAAEAIRAGLAEALMTIREEVSRLETALRSSGTAIGSQVSAISDATSQTRLVSDAFAKTAIDLRAAATPLTQSGERIAAATDKFESSLSAAVRALDNGQSASSSLAQALQGHGDRLVEKWRDYEQRFVNVDGALARTVEQLASATERQGNSLGTYAEKIDQGLAQAVQHLSSTITDIEESVEEFGEHVAELKTALQTAGK